MKEVGVFICQGETLQTPPGGEGKALVNVHFVPVERNGEHLSLVMEPEASDYKASRKYRFFSEPVEAR